MPEIHDPHQELLLPGAVQPMNRRRRRRSVHVTSHTHAANKTPLATASRAPLEALDFDFENHSLSINSINQRKKMLPIQEIQSPKKTFTPSSATSVPKSRKKAKQRKFASSPSSPSPYKPTLPPIPSQTAGFPQQPSLSNQKLSVAPSHVRHALLVDTRTLDTKEGTAASHDFINNLRQFLSSMRCRSMAPHLLACLHPLPATAAAAAGTPRRGRPPMVVKALHVLGNARLTVSVDCFCEPLLIQPATNAGNTRNVKAVKVPTRLLAQASWEVFGDLVEEAVQQDQKSPSASRKVPLTVTLLTNDVALFCDSSNAAAHKPALKKFWNRIRPFFHKNNLRSIELFVLETGTVKLLLQDGNHMETVDEVAEEDESNKMDTGVGDASQESCVPTETNHPTVSSNTSMVAQCAQEIRQYLTELGNADYKVDRSRDGTVTPISLCLTLLDNHSRSFGILGRRWISQLLSPPNLKGNITFELPETMDGTQCSINLDVKYRLLPYPADSPCVSGMLADLDLLSSSRIETIQVVPVSCIDANLLFGVTMKVLPGFQNDEDRFQEMKGLVYVLLKQLRAKDVAILLHANNPIDAKSDFGQPLHHMCHQTYLLMAQDFPDTPLSQEEATVAPLEASLFRYGNAEQLLSVESTDLYAPKVEDGALLSQLHDYVDSALDMIPKDSINPLVNEELRVMRELEKMTLIDAPPSIVMAATPVQDMEMDEQDNWNDESGVGSRPKPLSDTASQSVPISESRKGGVPEREEWNDKSGVSTTFKVPPVAPDSATDSPPAPSATKPKKPKVVQLCTPKRKKPNEVKPSQESDISLDAPTAALVEKSKIPAPAKAKTLLVKSKDASGSKDDISEPTSQDSWDEISELAPPIAATQKLTHNSIFDQLTSSDESDDDWKGYKSVHVGGASQKTKLNLRMVTKAARSTKQGNDDENSASNSTDDDALFSKMFKTSADKQSPAAALLQSFDDTDSDTESD